MSNDERTLIQCAKQGDAAACAELYNRHYDAVYRYCYYRVADVSLAQDLTSDVFVRMVESLDKFDMRGRPLLAWLYTIARNLVIDTYRRQNHVARLLSEDLFASEEGNPVSSAERRLLADSLSRSLEYLTEEQRQVILLKFVQELDNSQVARLMNKPEGAIKSLQHRALAALRRVLQKEPCYET